MVRKIGIYREKRNKNRPWTVRWFGEPDETGNPRRYQESFKLRAEAEAFRAEKLMAFKEGEKRDRPEAVTLKDFCSDWLKTRRPGYRPETVKLYENTISRLLNYEGFGEDMLLSKISTHKATKFIAELKPLKSKDQLSNWSRHRTLRNCKTIFTDAVTWGIIIKNPFTPIKRPKLIQQRWHYVTPSEYLSLLDAAPTLRWQAFYALAYTSGLRLGELLSLQWGDIDFEIGEVRIQNRPATVKLPPFFIKDYESRRIPLPGDTLNILAELHAEASEGIPYVLLNEQEYETALNKWQRYQKEGRSWANRDLQNNTLTTFKRHAKRAGIKANGSLSIHTLRKSCITNWANRINNPQVTQTLAGHADLSTTLSYYSQVTLDQRDQAAKAINEMLNDVKVTYK